MTTDTHAQTYTCPKCSKAHAADLSAMEGHPEIHGKVRCMQCHTWLWLSMNEDGNAQCELFEAHLHEMDAAKAASKEAPAGTPGQQRPDTSPQAPATRQASGIVPILIAAIVAAGVSFLVARATGESATQPADVNDGADTAKIEQQVNELKSQLDTATSGARAASAGLQSAVADLQTAVERNAASLKAMPTDHADLTAALQARIEKLAGEYKTLNGRIESNYNAFRIIKKQLEARGGN